MRHGEAARSDGRRRTLVAVHAHPDDEALLMAGTLARASAAGHRVVLAVATDGDLGLASAQVKESRPLGERRLDELRASADALGVHRVVHLGWADSGMGPETYPDPEHAARFVRVPVEDAATRVAELLEEESADVVSGYDAAGGYGHRDHVHLHHVVRRARELAGTPRLVEATIPRDTIARAVRLAGRVYRFPPEFDPTSFERAFSPRAAITHRVDVRRFIGAKRAAMRAHASQASADADADRTLAAFLRIPRPLFDLVFGREWFLDPDAEPGGRRPDVLGGLP